jgi:hypothetical protein
MLVINRATIAFRGESLIGSVSWEVGCAGLADHNHEANVLNGVLDILLNFYSEALNTVWFMGNRSAGGTQTSRGI